MLTIFSTPKPFTGHINTIQRNAIRSWSLLRPKPEIILLGNAKGIRKTCKELRLKQIKNIRLNKHGTPLIDDMFKKAQEVATNNLLCYVNADIILMRDFMRAVDSATSYKKNFVMGGQRWNINIYENLKFAEGWEDKIRKFVTQSGRLYKASALDYLVFRKGIFSQIPPFALGRFSWDNWLLYKARAHGGALINATPTVMAVHQNHDYSHVASGEIDPHMGPESQRNLKLAGGFKYIYSLDDATHILSRGGLKSNFLRRVYIYYTRTLDIYLGELGIFLKKRRPGLYDILVRLKKLGVA